MTDDFEPNPPDAADVARRAVILKYQFVYVATTPPPQVIANIGASWPPEERDGLAQHLEEARTQTIEQLQTIGLWEDTAPTERELFEQPASHITDQQRINTSWRAEATHCLAWALGLVDEIPEYDAQTDPMVLIPLIPVDDLVALCRDARLRGAEEIEAAREIAELWHWRSRTRQLQQDGYVPRRGQPSLDRVVRDIAPRLAAAGTLSSTVDDDFAVLGRAYRDLTDAEWATARSIAMQRHFALNWLCGYAPGNEWDETPTDT